MSWISPYWGRQGVGEKETTISSRRENEDE